MNDGSALHETIGAHELASAFALASLATMSPSRQNTNELAYESRDADHGDEAAPISPDVRSPVRSLNKRVTFTTDTKETSRQTSRKLSFPPRSKPHGSRMPPGFARGHYAPRTQQHLPPPWMRQRMMAHQASMFMPPPPPMMPSMPPPSDKWICDFCNVAAFDTYQEACIHEVSCRVRCSIPQRRAPEWNPSIANPRPMYPQSHSTVHSAPLAAPTGPVHSESRVWYQGTTSLAIPDSDRDWLSGLNCFIRERCVEAFSATEDDVSKTSKRGRITPHQVGIRCRFCSHRPKEEMQVVAISYPVSVAGIYESVKRWQKVHLDACEDVPQDVKTKLEELGSTNAWIPTTRQYWADSARSMGMVDTQDGIRFSTDPKTAPVCFDPDFQGCIESTNCEPTQTSISKTKSRSGGKEGPSLADGDNIVHPEDMAMVPPYVYFLMRQVERTHFTEADRFVARSKGPVGYPGFQCRHCHGHAGLGKYFPVSSKSLSTNSTSQNIHSHLLKCRKVAPYVKEQLITLKEEKSKAPRLEPGWRRVFFEKIWSRLHG
jgi:hypothetical protein